jgi:LuxR family maltose regulon positive regulatory protein
MRALAAALTKFRIPRLRADAVERPAVLARLRDSVANQPVTLVCAPGGSGKTILMTQLATALQASHAVLWIALDADDDDPNRLFAALVQAVEPLGLTWEVEPQSLVAGIGGGASRTRAALGAWVNAICTVSSPRVLLVLDDLHRLGRPETFALLDALVERLPEQVSLLLGTRVMPPLALARWRAHGELGEFGAADLRFSAADAAALCRQRGASIEAAALERALARSGGWAVGLSMLLQSRAFATAPGDTQHRHLFAYLAQEILASLPTDLQDFVVQTSILPELDPVRCGAVLLRDDCRPVLEALYARNLLLTAVDETVPVLRFHDLLREFLQLELARRHPQLIAELHLRAARAESVPAQAVHHYLHAEHWDEAVNRIAELGEGLIGSGALSVIERWIAQIPPEHRNDHPQIAYLQGTCAWLRWEWERTRRELPKAIAGLQGAANAPRRIRALFQLIDAANSSGDLDGARRWLDEVAQLPLDDLGLAELALQRAWCHAPDREADAVAEQMHEFVRHVARDPARICPITAGRVHCILVGIPGVTEALQEFVMHAETVREATARPWHLALHAIDGWSRMWHGELAAAERALQRAQSLSQQFGAIRLMNERIGQCRAVVLGAQGRTAEAIALGREHLQALQHPELVAHRATWQRAYQHATARFSWIVGDTGAWQEFVPQLLAPRRRGEWPFADAAAQIIRGQLALVNGDWDSAIQILETAVRRRPRLIMPAFCNDPRPSLAYALLRRDGATAAWQVLEPVVDEVMGTRAYGLLILDRREHVDALLDAMPAQLRRGSAALELQRTLALWRGATAPNGARSAPAELQLLSEREREVLEHVARGASNKHIARELDLSLHTVKRHLANILQKLDCDSRGEAAERFRRVLRPD